MTPRRPQTFLAAGEPDQAPDSVATVIAGWHASRPDLRVEPIAITARLARLQSLVAPRLEAVTERFGIRGADFAVLATLVRLPTEDLSQRRLAAELGLSAGTISVRVDRLLRKGLAARRPDPEDGRGAVISITERGRELFEACAPEHLANAQELLAGLSEAEREALGSLLGKLLYTLEDREAEGGASPELGLVLEAAPVALERRRAVGLPPLPGLLVRHVDPAGPAAAGGVRPGDLITSANRHPLRSRHDLAVALTKPRGRRRALALEITRGADSMRLVLSVPSHGGGDGSA